MKMERIFLALKLKSISKEAKICRKSIRDHLIHLKVNEPLFHRVAQLNLPPLLRSYLLYDESPQKYCSDACNFDMSQEWSCVRLTPKYIHNHWRIQGERQGRAPPRGSKFFYFHVVFGKNVKNNSNFGSWRPPWGKSWIRH